MVDYQRFRIFALLFCAQNAEEPFFKKKGVAQIVAHWHKSANTIH
jgi:hypothetical protein